MRALVHLAVKEGRAEKVALARGDSRKIVDSSAAKLVKQREQEPGWSRGLRGRFPFPEIRTGFFPGHAGATLSPVPPLPLHYIVDFVEDLPVFMCALYQLRITLRAML